MRYIIKGLGGQGVLFLAKVAAEALLSRGVDDFTFLKEFDEGQRNGEIAVTFTLPFDSPDKTLVIDANNMIELRQIAKDFGLGDEGILKALERLKPEFSAKNFGIFKGL